MLEESVRLGVFLNTLNATLAGNVITVETWEDEDERELDDYGQVIEDLVAENLGGEVAGQQRVEQEEQTHSTRDEGENERGRKKKKTEETPEMEEEDERGEDGKSEEVPALSSILCRAEAYECPWMARRVRPEIEVKGEGLAEALQTCKASSGHEGGLADV